MSQISVLLPVAAACDTASLQRAHRSIAEQTVPPAEILICTNQPLTTDIENAIEHLVDTNSGSKHERIPDTQGLGEVLEIGLRRCSEPFVARMDADDVADPERFAEQLDILRGTKVDIVGSQLAEFRDDPEHPERIRQVPLTHDEIAAWMPWRCPVNHPTVMFDRDAVLEVGGYRDFPMEDWDLWARSLAAGLRFRNLDQILVKAHLHGFNDRRGGLGYARAEVRMARELHELGISSRRDQIKHLALRVPPRLLPPQLRDKIYQLFVR